MIIAESENTIVFVIVLLLRLASSSISFTWPSSRETCSFNVQSVLSVIFRNSGRSNSSSSSGVFSGLMSPCAVVVFEAKMSSSSESIKFRLVFNNNRNVS